MNDINRNCQVFTPANIVSEMLDKVNYRENLFGQKVLENSCGDGAFLVEIVDRYITDCISNGTPLEQIARGLETDIYGTEIDHVHRATCIANLDQIAKNYGLKGVHWNILQIDFLKEALCQKFQFIIGNPPYITYSDLSLENRAFIKSQFNVCRLGKPDYYYAFIEKSIGYLSENGKFIYLIPNNIFKTRFANDLRNFILPHLIEITDYSTQKLFSKLTSSAIIFCTAETSEIPIRYINKVQNKVLQLDKATFTDKWIFKNANANPTHAKRRFGDDFKVTGSVATLLNNVFILDKYEELEQFLIIKKHKLEKSIVREAVSPRSLQYDVKKIIVFPYCYNEQNELVKYSEKEFKKKFPLARKYLHSFRKELDNRDSDNSAKWFEFGRSQSIIHLNAPKLLLSTLVTDNVKLHKLTAEQVPYAGISIYQKGKLSLNKAYRILTSPEFLNYVHEIGINANGNTMRISIRDVQNFEYTPT